MLYKEEIKDFIAHPVFGVWWLMGNLEGWGGPVSDTLIEQQKELQQKILERMRELGIEPVMQGFYGMVPTTLKDKLSAGIIPQGRWAGGFQRPDFLLPTDPNFKRVAQIYYQEMKRLYGDDLRHFGGDPFHEGGNSSGVDVALASSAIQKEMMQAFPQSCWVLQGWGENPGTKLLQGLDKRHALVIELFGENTDNWEKRKGYEDTPFLRCNVSNFGEKNGLYGKLKASEPKHRTTSR
ncbi:alpha-N-acetylglucosaminidase TIM-barrel domain-containing protein [Porphyromonas sp. COT-108 OH2963]|uniref:alpha-N-acetylglucosaminidase TIM-barrel domain-containing protein n=1 Tax=Porphyromonas sp. COT-108 OH2963 TaxID=1515614 RepID=UPI0021D30F11|nr:alpha-N-acetylglucosaminidase TIM-barrel domain-containing protein [Porphyromonas sp. COT-108 OH2963]